MSLKRASLKLILLLLFGVSANAWSQTRVESGITHLDGKIEELRIRQHSLKRLLAEGQSEQEILRRRIIARGRAYYRLARGVPSGDFFEHAVRVERLRRGIIHDLAAIKALSERRAHAGAGLKELDQQRAPLEEERRVTGRAHDALRSQQERDAAFQRAFGKEKGQNHTAIYAAERQQAGGIESFVKLRGRLAFPLAGRAEVRELVALDSSRLLSFESVVAASVRSIAAGQVVDIGQSSTGERSILLDHGQGYFSLTSGVESLDVSIGDDLPAHARLGTLAASSQNAVHQLTIELRKNSKVLAPSDWFGL